MLTEKMFITLYLLMLREYNYKNMSESQQFFYSYLAGDRRQEMSSHKPD